MYVGPPIQAQLDRDYLIIAFHRFQLLDATPGTELGPIATCWSLTLEVRSVAAVDTLATSYLQTSRQLILGS